MIMKILPLEMIYKLQYIQTLVFYNATMIGKD